MVYRKTAKVLAQLAAKRAVILGAALDVVAKHGLAGLTTDAIATRAGIAEGGLYRHFASIDDIVAALAADVLARDLAVMAKAGTLDGAIAAWGGIIFGEYRTRKHIGTLPIYREGIRRELEALMERALARKDVAFCASIVVGCLFDWAARVPRLEKRRISDLLMAIGASQAQKVR